MYVCYMYKLCDGQDIKTAHSTFLIVFIYTYVCKRPTFTHNIRHDMMQWLGSTKEEN